jgi:hypothetical protein
MRGGIGFNIELGKEVQFVGQCAFILVTPSVFQGSIDARYLDCPHNGLDKIPVGFESGVGKFALRLHSSYKTVVVCGQNSF